MLMGLKIYFCQYSDQEIYFVCDIDEQTIKYLFASKVTHVVYVDPNHCLDQGVRPI